MCLMHSLPTNLLPCIFCRHTMGQTFLIVLVGHCITLLTDFSSTKHTVYFNKTHFMIWFRMCVYMKIPFLYIIMPETIQLKKVVASFSGLFPTFKSVIRPLQIDTSFHRPLHFLSRVSRSLGIEKN